MSSEPQDALVRAAQAGDQRARNRLATAYLPLVYNIVGRALNGHADTDDVVQETMLRVLDDLGGLRSPESFRSWLVAITMNQLRGYWRRNGAEAAPPMSLEDAQGAPPVADFVDATVLRLGLSGQRYEVAQATRWLDEGDRTLLSLWWLEAAGQLTRAEVASAMELSAQHTAVRVQRMKGQLETARVVVRALAAEPRCMVLDSMASGWDGIPSSLWRKRLARHTRDCAVCSGRSSDLVPAERLLVGLALVPVVSAGVTPRTSGLAAAQTTAHPAGPFPTGPSPTGPSSAGPGRAALRRRSRRRRRAIGLATVAVLLSTGAGVVHLTTGPDEDEERSADVATRAESAPPSHSPRPEPSPSKSSASPSASPTSASPSPSRTAKKTAKPRPSTPPPKPKPTPSTREPAPAPRGPAAQVVALVNTERAKKGCGPVRANSKLDAAASGHSADMASRDFFDHTNPDGEGPGERITAAGYSWSTYGENIAMGQTTPEQVMKGWMDSPGHRANILNCSYKEMGLGLRQGSGGPWWTQAFGAR